MKTSNIMKCIKSCRIRSSVNLRKYMNAPFEMLSDFEDGLSHLEAWSYSSSMCSVCNIIKFGGLILWHNSTHSVTYHHMTSPHVKRRHNLTPHDVTQHLMTSHNNSCRHTTPHDVTQHLMTSHNTSWRHTTPHDLTQHLMTSHNTSWRHSTATN